MTTTTPAQITLPNINIAQLQAGLAGIANVLPIISTFFPQAAPILAFMPLLQEGLSVAADVQAKWGDPAAVIDALATHLQSLAQQVQAMKPHAVAAASGTLTPQAINFQAPQA